MRVKLGEGLLGGGIGRGESLWIEDVVTLDRKTLSALDLLQCAEAAAGAWLVVPIRHGTEVLGTLSFRCGATARDVLEAEMRLLGLAVGQIGLAVRFRELAKERSDSLHRKNERLQKYIKKCFVPDGMIGKHADA